MGEHRVTIALWCVLAAGLLPYPFAMAAKWSSRFDNARPREYFAQTSGWRQRAHWVQLNSYESFPLFASAVIIAHLLAGAQPSADALALAFVALRLIFGLCYLLNLATLRSLAWLAGQACSIALFVLAARAA